MALLIFPPENLSPQLAELVDPHLRSVVANRVNEAILHSQGARCEAEIRKLIRTRVWSEKMARDGGAGTGSGRKVDLPDKLDWGLDDVRSDAGTEGGREGHNGTTAGNGDTAMAGNGEAEGLVT